MQNSRVDVLNLTSKNFKSENCQKWLFVSLYKDRPRTVDITGKHGIIYDFMFRGWHDKL